MKKICIYLIEWYQKHISKFFVAKNSEKMKKRINDEFSENFLLSICANSEKISVICVYKPFPIKNPYFCFIKLKSKKYDSIPR